MSTDILQQRLEALKRNLAGQYEKLAFFERELGITASAATKFELSHQIEELRQRIKTLEEEIAQVQAKLAKDFSTTKLKGGTDLLIDFAILTALEIERKAVCAVLGLTDDHREKRESRVYWRGRLPLKNGEFYEIVVAQSPDMANVDSALITNDTFHHWKPGAALMVGIAASAHKEVKLGDVVAGSWVYYYERSKETPTGSIPEPYMLPVDATLWSNVSALPDWKSEILETRPDNTSTRPGKHHGVIASGEKVIASEATRQQIADGHRKIRAMEMEGYGFSKAAWQSFERVRALVIRGISDDGTPTTKDDEQFKDKWHSYAAAAAASFAKHFLLDRPLGPRNHPQ